MERQEDQQKHGVSKERTSVDRDRPVDTQLLNIQQTSPYQPVSPSSSHSTKPTVKEHATTLPLANKTAIDLGSSTDPLNSTETRLHGQTPNSRLGPPPPPPPPQPQNNRQRFAQQFIFEKPTYNHHYKETHFNHLDRHDSFFDGIKHLFHPLTSRRSSTRSSASSTPSFGNEFNKDLEQRYGKWGSFVGQGSSGSVRVIRRAADNKVFAVKEYRKRLANESERDYVKKVTAEFCIASTLHHRNIVETLDIIQEGGTFYQVMEYAPFDMFTVVMESTMSAEEIDCCWRQLLDGVAYLQSVGIGHRDLKLENLVMSARNVVKIIDFGTAIVVRYPFQKEETLCSGIFGSDPYIAPEQYSQKEYSAFSADLWSCGVIFVCMVLRRFAWRVPRPGLDANYRLYLNNRGSLLAYIPRYARPTIARLLEPNPQDRITLPMLMNDPWVASISTCPSSSASHHHHSP